MDAAPSAWAAITHQRFLLRRLAQQSVLDPRDLLAIARQLSSLGEQVREPRLVSVAQAVLLWGSTKETSEKREQGGILLIELYDAVDRLPEARWSAAGAGPGASGSSPAIAD
jgi:hypothetical protein